MQEIDRVPELLHQLVRVVKFKVIDEEIQHTPVCLCLRQPHFYSIRVYSNVRTCSSADPRHHGLETHST